jgi:excisionase family DNA binding protein
MRRKSAQLRTVRQTAERLTVAPQTIRLWMSTGRLGFVRLGRAVRIPDSEIERLLDQGWISAKR